MRILIAEDEVATAKAIKVLLEKAKYSVDSYSTIWEGEITDTSTADHRRVVTALKHISEGTELEKYLDVDNVLKYMAVHTFAVNMDSLSGSMAHNYYLYEYDGQLNILPWDYNLSFGGMSMGSTADATQIVNDAIDTPFSGTKFFNALLENEEYLERYHSYLNQLVEEYVNGGRFEEVYNRIRSQIDSLVESDPTAFYSYEEYLTAADLLYQTILLRAESIEGQLSGTIPSTDAGQKADSSSLIDASHIDVNAMGQFNMGGSFGGNAWKKAKEGETNGEAKEVITKEGEATKGKAEKGSNFSFDRGKRPDMSGMDPSGMDPSGMDPSGMDLSGFDPSGMDMSGFDPSSMDRSGFDPSSFGGSGFPGQSVGNSSAKNLVTYAGCLVVMLLALTVAKAYKRRKIK